MFDGELYELAKKKGILVDATIELLTKCNLRCKHCYLPKHNSIMDYELAIKVMDILFDEGTINLTFTGGEVFCHPDFEKIYLYAKRKGFIIEIKSNGTLINGKWIEIFRELPPDEINISLYGLNNEDYEKFTGDSNGFEKLVNNINKLRENDIEFSMHVIGNTYNYDDLLSGKYREFSALYNIELGIDNDILNQINGSKKPSEYRLNENEIINIEFGSNACREKIQRDYVRCKKMLDNEFECIGGKNKVFVAADGNIHACLFDDNISFSLKSSKWKTIRQQLVLRNQEIMKLYQVSKCNNCKKDIMCRKCPLKWNRVNDVDARCGLAVIRKKRIQHGIKQYHLDEKYIRRAGFKEISCSLIFPNYGLRENEINNESEFYSQIAHYNVNYNVNGEIIAGNMGKTFYYIPVLSQKVSEQLGISVGHALKLLKYCKGTEEEIDMLLKSRRINNILYENKVAPKCFSNILLTNRSYTEAFINEGMVSYPQNSVLVGYEVEHLSSVNFNSQKNVFRGNLISNELLQNEIENYLLQSGIRGKDLWLGNMINTCDGIKLIDFYGWEYL